MKAGEAKAKEVCQACHGLDGNSSTPDYPKLGGQHPDYLGKALRDYKSGARKTSASKSGASKSGARKSGARHSGAAKSGGGSRKSSGRGSSSSR